MAEAELAKLLDEDGPAAPPRVNGELTFEAPWQGRAFGLVMSLAERGVLDYEEFRAELIAAVAAADCRSLAGEASFSYYDCWLEALERVLTGRGLVGPQALAGRVALLAARPHGHDHDHRPDQR